MSDIVEKLNELSRWMIANDIDMRMSKEMIDPAVGGAEITALRAEIERLRAALRRAREDLEAWSGYASEYFREKHDLNGDLAAIDTTLGGTHDVR